MSAYLALVEAIDRDLDRAAKRRHPKSEAKRQAFRNTVGRAMMALDDVLVVEACRDSGPDECAECRLCCPTAYRLCWRASDKVARALYADRFDS